jgi:predicted alpha/beta hydrolase family esterase
MPTDDPPVLVVPGIWGSGPTHWQTRWVARSPRFRLVEQRDWDHPTVDEWSAALDREVAGCDRRPLLAVHSLGCALVAHWAGRSHAPVRGALLVGPADVDDPSRMPPESRGFSPIPMAALGFPSVLVASHDDAYVTFERAEAMAAAWGSELVDVGRRGHINADSGLGDWPEGLALLERLATSDR